MEISVRFEVFTKPTKNKQSNIMHTHYFKVNSKKDVNVDFRIRGLQLYSPLS